MHVDLVWLATAILSFPLFTLCDPLNVLVAPNLLRVGSSEKVFVESQDYTGNDLLVKISVKNYPQKNTELVSTSVTLTAGENFQALVDIKIPDNKNFFSDDPAEKQYVYLQAQFPSNLLEKVVLVSFQSGYIFAQTDKSIYTPKTTVHYRIFSLTPNLQPIEQSAGILVEIINPQGITISQDTVFPKQGVITGTYSIPEVAKSGIWSLVTRYKNTPQKNFTAEFEVKEYVLPSFEVELKPSKPFFYVNDQELQVDITAKYLFGKSVEGVAFVVFGIRNNDIKTSLPASLQREQIINGEGRVVLKKEMIEKSFKDILELVGSSLYISVNVLTETGSEMVEAERGGIQIVTSPYTIQFKRTPKYYHPGVSFDVTVYVSNPDQTPAENVDVLVKPGDVKGRTKSNGMAKVKVNTEASMKTLDISAETNVPDISSDRQAKNKMTAQAYSTKGGSTNYLHLSANSAELQVGDQMNFDLDFKSSLSEHDFTYLILSKGQIVEARRFRRRGQSQLADSILVTKDMLPSFRVVAYYHVGSSEVVSDSIWVDVKDDCMGKLKLRLKEPVRVFNPGEEFNLIVTGDPNAKVGLVAVDKAVFLLNKNRLTTSKIWDIIEKHDTGCTAGSGRDSMGVFYDAGLLFESDKAGGTSERTAPECPVQQKRKRRAVTLQQLTETLVGKYSGEQKKCCADGLRKNRLGYTCERRATFILDGSDCVNAFLDCCRESQKQKDKEKDLLLLSRSEDDDDDYISSDEIVSRTQFPESWLWEDITMPSCKNNQNCETTEYTLPTSYLKDSITTWEILAISLSKTHGICVADPYQIIVAKDFFVDLKLPYSAVRNEQIEIKAILHNFSNKQQKVRVEFFKTEHVCSAASKKNHRVTVVIDAKSTRAIPYVIIPMELGEHQIEVQAASAGWSYHDGVRKTLKVVSEGVLTELPEQNVELNPSQRPGGVQVVRLKTDIPHGQVPNTPAHTTFTVAGQEVSQTIEQAISGNFMGRLIVQPDGCGEQTMIYMTLPLIATHYLDTTKQWEGVGLSRRSEAIQHIKTGYTRELTFRKEDGSYAAWQGRPSSTWLTAYVSKVFAMASNLISIDEQVLCSAIKWLILNTQMPDGTFKESAPVVHAEMVGDVRGKDADASLTAFVLIALQEGRHLCGKLVGSLPESSKKAVNYLETRLHSLTNPYAIAMSSYALANEGKLNKDLLLKVASEDGSYWQVAGGHHFTLEATAYALLALVKVRDYDAAGKAVHWLNRQSSPYGGYGTTQTTIMVFQAVAEYYKQVRNNLNKELDVEVSVSGRNTAIRWKFSKDNSHLTRSDKVQVKQEFNVTAKGNGAGVLKVMTLYYARPIEKKSDCTKYDLSVKMQEQELSYPDAEKSFDLIIDILYKDPTRSATMTILDISLLTGFVVDTNDLNDLTSGKDKYIQKFEMNKQLSERGSLILYLDKVSNKVPDRIVFKVHKITKVALLQPAGVSVYEYYAPDARCVKFYHPIKKDGALNRLCSDQEGLCQCAEENCSIQKKEKIEEKDREKKACEADMDYVYKVRVVGLDQSPNTDFYDMKIEQVLKEGSDPDVHEKQRSFMGHANCRESFGFEEGKTFLIMGKSIDLPRIDGKLQYILGEQTWIEYWPTREEGQTAKYREKYMGITSLAQTLTDFGCTT